MVPICIGPYLQMNVNISLTCSLWRYAQPLVLCLSAFFLFFGCCCCFALFICKPNPFFALVFSILWLLYCECFMHYTLAVIASGYSILIRSHSLLSVCTKILSQHLPNRIFQWICAYDKRHSEKNVNIHIHIYSFWSMKRQMSRSDSESKRKRESKVNKEPESCQKIMLQT